MRTGSGPASSTEQTTLEANAGLVKLHKGTHVKDKRGDLIVMNRWDALISRDQKGRERERDAVVCGARLKVKDGRDVEQGQLLVEWDRIRSPLIVEDGQDVSAAADRSEPLQGGLEKERTVLASVALPG